LVLFYDKEILDSITPSFCLPFEKELLLGVKEIYEHVDLNLIKKIINFTNNFLELKSINSNLVYGSSKTFLYQIQAGFFNYLFINDKEKRDYFNQIENEIKWYNKFDSVFKNFWSIDNSIKYLNDQNENARGYVENENQTEIYKKKINELIDTINEDQSICDENYKEKLINLLKSKLSKPTKEIFEAAKEKIENFIKNSKNELSENHIKFPLIRSNGFQRNDLLVCINILKEYSLQHKKLSDIFKNSKDILKEIFELDKEIGIITDILGKYVLEKGEYLHMYESQVMGIIRALVLFKIIKKGGKEEGIEKILNLFLKLPEIINDQTGGNGSEYFNEDVLKWTKNQIETDLQEYLIIPKFEPKDFLYLFLITYSEEQGNKQTNIINKGFLLKDLKNNELENILNNSLKIYVVENLSKEDNKYFVKYIDKIGRSLFKNILPDKCNSNFDELSINDFESKLKDEKKALKNQFLELKKNNQRDYNLEMNLEIIRGIINCFTLAVVYENNYSNTKLTYEDIGFFENKNWEKELMLKYPGMLFWLLSNYYSFYDDLMSKKGSNGCFITKDNQISFWLFQIRVFSNISTFEYICYKQKKIRINNKDLNVFKELEDDYGENNLKKEIEKYIQKNIRK